MIKGGTEGKKGRFGKVVEYTLLETGGGGGSMRVVWVADAKTAAQKKKGGRPPWKM